MTGYENANGSWTNVRDDGTTFTDREAWMHVPELVARARTAAAGNIAAKHLRRILIDSWCQPVADWLTKRLARG